MTIEERAEAIRFFEKMLELEPNIKDANFRYSRLALEALKQVQPKPKMEVNNDGSN